MLMFSFFFFFLKKRQQQCFKFIDKKTKVLNTLQLLLKKKKKKKNIKWKNISPFFICHISIHERDQSTGVSLSLPIITFFFPPIYPQPFSPFITLPLYLVILLDMNYVQYYLVSLLLLLHVARVYFNQPTFTQ